MDLAELVRAAVAEALTGGRACSGPLVLVLGARDETLAAHLRPRLGPDAELLFLGEDTGGRAPERRILPELCCAGMADLALGRASGPVLTEVLGLLLSGKTVEVLEFAWRRHAHSAPPALARLYQGYERTLASYGLIAFQEGETAGTTGRGGAARRRVITERQVKEAAARGARALAAPERAVITPLARDAARELNIHIFTEL